MKSNKGITLTSLIIYVIVFMIVIATVSTISGYFTKNTNDVMTTVNSSEQYTRLTTYVIEDINSINISEIIVSEDGTNITITFLDGLSHKYLYNNEKIYYISEKDGVIDKTITICNKVEECTFTKDEENNKLKISINIEGITYNNNYSI